MVIKLSDYILEQSVSDAQVVDIFLEHDLAEIEVYTMLCKAYLKQIELCEYYNPTDENVAPDVVTEAEAVAAAPAEDGGEKESTNPIVKALKAVAGAIGGFFKWIGNKIGALGDKIKKNSKKYKEMAANATDEDYQRLKSYLLKLYERDPSRMYAAYSPTNIKEFLDTLAVEIPNFAKESEAFISFTKGGLRGMRPLRKDEKRGILSDSNAKNLQQFNAYLDHFDEVMRKTNPYNKNPQGVGEDVEGFKDMIKSYIMYYTSNDCINAITRLKNEGKKAFEIIFKFNRRYQVTGKSTTNDYYYDHDLPMMAKHWDRDLHKTYKDDDYAQLKKTVARAINIVSANSSNSILGSIRRLDENLKALEVLGRNQVGRLDGEYDSPEGKDMDSSMFNKRQQEAVNNSNLFKNEE